MKKYIEFNLVYQLPKTEAYAVRNIKSQMIIGYIKWYGAWRQYCFFTEPNTVYSKDCLKDIIDFIDKQARSRKRYKVMISTNFNEVRHSRKTAKKITPDAKKEIC